MTYARIVGGLVTEVGPPPRLYRDGARWWDWRDPAVRVPATFAPHGWLPLVETPRPADTDTTTHDYTVELVDGKPTVVWVARQWTAAELAARTAETNAASIRDKARQALTVNSTYLGLASPTNAQTLAQVRALTRQVTALIKLEIRELSDTSGT